LKAAIRLKKEGVRKLWLKTLDDREDVGEQVKELTYELRDIPSKLAKGWTAIITDWAREFREKIHILPSNPL
jgi:hypothetical protein